MLKRYFSGLSKSTFLLAATSLFADIATEMLYPVLPIFLTQNLKAGGSILGLVEGIAQATQNIIQGFSGTISDKIQKRKAVAATGYALAAISKPLIGLSTVWQGVLGARFMDRLGTGIRSAPRDALIAESVDDQNRGKAFGIESAGDNLGAFLGPLLAIVLLFFLKVDIHYIFYIAFIPGVAAFVMILLVKERKIIKSKSALKISTKFQPAYWKYLGATAIFGLGNSSNAFLILQTKNIGVSTEVTILIYAFFNLVAAVASYPSGFFSDKIGRKNILLASFVIFLAVYIGFGFSSNIYLIGMLFLLYGIFQGIFRAVGKALATDLVPSNLRASGIGWYSTTVGLTTLIASIAAGQLWDKYGHESVFIYGAIFAFIGSIALVILVPSKKPLTN